MGKDQGSLTRQAVCYRPPRKDKEEDDILYKQPEPRGLALMGNSAYQMCAGNTMWQRGKSLEGSWSMQKRSA